MLVEATGGDLEEVIADLQQMIAEREVINEEEVEEVEEVEEAPEDAPEEEAVENVPEPEEEAVEEPVEEPVEEEAAPEEPEAEAEVEAEPEAAVEEEAEVEAEPETPEEETPEAEEEAPEEAVEEPAEEEAVEEPVEEPVEEEVAEPEVEEEAEAEVEAEEEAAPVEEEAPEAEVEEEEEAAEEEVVEDSRDLPVDGEGEEEEEEREPSEPIPEPEARTDGKGSRFTKDSLQASFDLFDVDRKAKVSAADMSFLMEGYGVQGQVFTKSEYTFADFVGFVDVYTHAPGSVEEIREAFGSFDVAEAGSLSVADIFETISVIDPRVTEAEVAEVVKYCAVQGGGESLSVEDFTHVAVEVDAYPRRIQQRHGVNEL